MKADSRLYGLMAEFATPAALVAASHLVHERGFRKVDAYTPYPIEEVAEALGLHKSPVPKVVLAGGVTGLVAGLGLEYWSSTIAYPMNVGGRPFASWVAFIPPAYETTILFAALAAVLGMLALNGLPLPYHPVFNVPSFALASRDRFFLCIESGDPIFDRSETRRFLEDLPHVAGVHEVQP